MTPFNQLRRTRKLQREIQHQRAAADYHRKCYLESLINEREYHWELYRLKVAAWLAFAAGIIVFLFLSVLINYITGR